MLQLLPKLRSYSSTGGYFYQQASVEGVHYKYACPLCVYKDEATSEDAFLKCASKHTCGQGYRPWLRMVPINQDEVDEAVDTKNDGMALYRETNVSKQVKIQGMPRYCKLIQCLQDGYRCNTLCHFFEDRILAKKTAAKCAAAKACGLNGSFWDVLIPEEEIFLRMMKWQSEEDPSILYPIDENIRWRVSDMKNVQYNDNVQLLGLHCQSEDGTRDYGYLPVRNIDPSSPDMGKYLADYGDWVALPSPPIISSLDFDYSNDLFIAWLLWLGVDYEALRLNFLW